MAKGILNMQLGCINNIFGFPWITMNILIMFLDHTKPYFHPHGNQDASIRTSITN